MKDLLERLDLIRCGLCDSEDGSDLLWLIKFRGVCCHFAFDRELTDDEEQAFEHALDIPTGEHYRDGLTYIIEVLAEATIAADGAGLPNEVSLAFATAREALESVNPFYWVAQFDSTEPMVAKRNARFDEVVSMLRNIRFELLRAYATVRRHVEMRPHQPQDDDCWEERTYQYSFRLPAESIRRLRTSLENWDSPTETGGEGVSSMALTSNERRSELNSADKLANLPEWKAPPTEAISGRALEKLFDCRSGTARKWKEKKIITPLEETGPRNSLLYEKTTSIERLVKYLKRRPTRELP